MQNCTLGYMNSFGMYEYLGGAPTVQFIFKKKRDKRIIHEKVNIPLPFFFFF